MIHHTGARGYAPYFATHPNPGCSSSPSPKPYHRSLPFYQLLAGQYATSQVAPCDSYRKLVPRSRVCANATGQAMSPHSSTKYDKERRQQQIKWHAHVRYSDGGCYVKRLRSMRSVEPHHRRNLQRNVTVTSPLQEITVQSPIATISIQAPAARSPHRKTCNKQLSLRLRPSPTTCEKQKGFSIERDKKKDISTSLPFAMHEETGIVHESRKCIYEAGAWIRDPTGNRQRKAPMAWGVPRMQSYSVWSPVAMSTSGWIWP